jgi:hypothetical protein
MVVTTASNFPLALATFRSASRPKRLSNRDSRRVRRDRGLPVLCDWTGRLRAAGRAQNERFRCRIVDVPAVGLERDRAFRPSGLRAGRCSEGAHPLPTSAPSPPSRGLRRGPGSAAWRKDSCGAPLRSSSARWCGRRRGRRTPAARPRTDSEVLFDDVGDDRLRGRLVVAARHVVHHLVPAEASVVILVGAVEDRREGPSPASPSRRSRRDRRRSCRAGRGMLKARLN